MGLAKRIIPTKSNEGKTHDRNCTLTYNTTDYIQNIQFIAPFSQPQRPIHLPLLTLPFAIHMLQLTQLPCAEIVCAQLT